MGGSTPWILSQDGESDAGNEGEAGVQDRTGKDVAGRRLPGQQGQDRGRLEKDRPGEEQDREDREQEGFRGRETCLQEHLRLDEGRAEGSEAAQGEGVRCGEERLGALQAREGPLRQV